MEKIKPIKEILAMNSSVIWFSVTLIKENLWDMDDDKLDVCLNDPEMFDVYSFENYTEAESFMIEALEMSEDYFYGMVCYEEYVYDSESEDFCGECKEFKCIAEAWADYLEEDEVVYYEQ